MRITIINGPNLNMLGIREKNIYGNHTLNDLNDYIQKYCEQLGIKGTFFQSNHEGAIIDYIHSCLNQVDGIVINPAAYSHYSVAILDALKSIDIPVVEVHISDLSKRESFRQNSITSLAAKTTISGYGFDSYLKGIDYLLDFLDKTEKKD